MFKDFKKSSWELWYMYKEQIRKFYDFPNNFILKLLQNEWKLTKIKARDYLKHFLWYSEYL